MRIKSIVWFAIAAVLALSTWALGRSDLPPNSRTGAPGESDCTGCHNDLGRLDSLSTTVRVTGFPSGYAPNTNYPVRIWMRDSRQRPPNTIYGFELTILRNSDNTRTGSISFTAGPIDTGRTATRTYLKQRTAGTFPGADSAYWNFAWRSPAGGTGPVTMYLAVVAGDNDGGNGGDSVSTRRYTTTESSGVEEGSDQWSRGNGPRLNVTPNPFSSFAVVPGHERESFVLYDIRGRVAGIYPGAKVGQELPAGIYFLRPGNNFRNETLIRMVKLR